ncbi:hypothetical protein DMR09_00490 [Klebsiella variicola]|nr:hypothetical protein CWM63_09790 [Klebsiella sp. F-Nf9]PKJ67864.1 hypothetical protein CW267_25445 [Klebsiella sp. X1-16S-Nf21]PXK13354.1 hypothetical protein DMR09_00490 [Klebsiella variicola]HBY0307998.1 hypothetical protein [Klebsiella pneumoniae subsp. pneumoniae]HBY4576162.1 hypothetical protein [Klebsiella pneumoniae]
MMLLRITIRLALYVLWKTVEVLVVFTCLMIKVKSWYLLQELMVFGLVKNLKISTLLFIFLKINR